MDRQWICIRKRKLLGTEFIHILDSYRCSSALRLRGNQFYELYTECENHIERHEIMWHEWNHNKRWLTQIQELILPSFPSYSRHDSSHSEAIIHNIEMLLGEENIQELSAPAVCSDGSIVFPS